MFYRNLFLIFLVSIFYLVQSKDFAVVYKKDREKKKDFEKANQFCQDNYPNGRLAIISNQESNEKIKRLLYEVGGSKFY